MSYFYANLHFFNKLKHNFRNSKIMIKNILILNDEKAKQK